MGEHTPTPWEVETPMGDETPWIVEAGLEAYQWRCIAMTCTESSDEGLDAITIEEAAANAAFIVKACNNHDTLVKALESFLLPTPINDEMLTFAWTAYNAATTGETREALAKATA